MQHTTIGSLNVKTDGKSLRIESKSTPEIEISLDAQGVGELLDFLTEMAGVQHKRRKSFRVPLSNQCGLAVNLIVGDRIIPAVPVDISMAGIFVILPHEHWLTFRESDNLEITLLLNDKFVQCRAIVRRNEHNGYGLFFPDSIKGEQLCPPEDLAAIVMELQREWLERRSKKKVLLEKPATCLTPPQPKKAWWR
jgi:hypothetical protein